MARVDSAEDDMKRMCEGTERQGCKNFAAYVIHHGSNSAFRLLLCDQCLRMYNEPCAISVIEEWNFEEKPTHIHSRY